MSEPLVSVYSFINAESHFNSEPGYRGSGLRDPREYPQGAKPTPTDGQPLGWVQLQQKSLLWQEMIEIFSVITHEGLTTLVHSSRMGWTITSGTWNHLRDKWGPTPETLSRIQASCKTQEYLEESNKLTPSRHILLALRQIWDLERIHGLPAVTDPTFFPSTSKNEECWLGTSDPKTIYVGDSMDDQDKQTSMSTLQETENWVVWKTRDKLGHTHYNSKDSTNSYPSTRMKRKT